MKESVLFVCDDNSILSPIAEAFLRRHGTPRFHVYSAGIEPIPIHLYTFQVMEEIGYELYGYRSKSIFELNHLQNIDHLITLTDHVNDHFVFKENNIGCHIHWPFKNPLHLSNTETNIFSLLSDPLPATDQWLISNSLFIKTALKTKIVIQTPAQEIPHGDIKEIKIRFRKVRDEMEVQVMNWLEEKGLGPLWWRR